ncbi:MAG: hypothetical protein WBW73_18670 [Rhodoplanes sp.]
MAKEDNGLAKVGVVGSNPIARSSFIQERSDYKTGYRQGWLLTMPVGALNVSQL